MSETATPLARIAGLTVQASRDGGVPADIVKGISLRIAAGEVLGLVGESGSGKSTTAYALFGYARSGMRISDGRVEIRGRDVLRLPEHELRGLRGREVALVPQNPGTSMTPSLRIGRSVAEVLRAHGMSSSARDAERRALELLAEVGLPEPRALARRYPHQLSGGQLQRVAIAQALACEPGLLVLDEPTTSLDVTSQAKVLALLTRLRSAHGVGMLYVTHDLGVLSQMCDRVAVMQAGEVVEEATVDELFRQPRHPYTRMLVGALPGFEHLDPGPGTAPATGTAHAGGHHD